MSAWLFGSSNASAASSGACGQDAKRERLSEATRSAMPTPKSPLMQTMLTPLPEGSAEAFPASKLVEEGPAVVYAIRRPG